MRYQAQIIIKKLYSKNNSILLKARSYYIGLFINIKVKNNDKFNNLLKSNICGK